jgi:CRP/FNR family transcriptional regulator, anaerobic regulatory protein
MEHNPLAQIRAYFFNLVPGLTEDKWKSFEQLVSIRRFKKGEVIIKPGQVCNHVSFVNYGLLRSYYLIDGKEIIAVFFHEDCYYSDYESFLSRKPSKMYTDVLEDTEVVDLDYDALQLLYNSYPECERAGRLVAEDLFVLLSNRNTSFLLQTPEQRYSQFLADWPGISNRIPQYMIASYLGITPEALSRIRSRMSRKQTIPVDLDQ